MHIDILKALARHGPLKLTHIMCKAKVNCGVLKQFLGFLAEHNLVEEQTLPKKRDNTRVVYAITEGGITAIKTFRELDIVLRITEEANMPALLY